MGEGNIAKPPKGTTHVVLDTPAGMHGKLFKEVMQLADKVVVPLQPSVFDIFATRAFLDELAEHRKASKMQVGIVGMRVDPRTIAADKLHEFVDSLGLPVLGYLRHTQNYIHLAARGLTHLRRGARPRRARPGAVGRHLSLARQVATPAACYIAGMKTLQSLAELPALVGQEVAVSDWLTVTQEQINLFAAGDRRPPVDPRRRRKGQGRPVRRARSRTVS